MFSLSINNMQERAIYIYIFFSFRPLFHCFLLLLLLEEGAGGDAGPEPSLWKRRTSRFSWHRTMSLQELLLSSSIAGERKINRHGVNFTYWCCGRSSVVTAGGLGGNPLMGVPVAVSAWGCSTWKPVPWGQTCLLGKAELPQLKA